MGKVNGPATGQTERANSAEPVRGASKSRKSSARPLKNSAAEIAQAAKSEGLRSPRLGDFLERNKINRSDSSSSALSTLAVSDTSVDRRSSSGLKRQDTGLATFLTKHNSDKKIQSESLVAQTGVVGQFRGEMEEGAAQAKESGRFEIVESALGLVEQFAGQVIVDNESDIQSLQQSALGVLTHDDIEVAVNDLLSSLAVEFAGSAYDMVQLKQELTQNVTDLFSAPDPSRLNRSSLMRAEMLVNKAAQLKATLETTTGAIETAEDLTAAARQMIKSDFKGMFESVVGTAEDMTEFAVAKDSESARAGDSKLAPPSVKARAMQEAFGALKTVITSVADAIPGGGLLLDAVVSTANQKSQEFFKLENEFGAGGPLAAADANSGAKVKSEKKFVGNPMLYENSQKKDFVNLATHAITQLDPSGISKAINQSRTVGGSVADITINSSNAVVRTAAKAAIGAAAASTAVAAGPGVLIAAGSVGATLVAVTAINVLFTKIQPRLETQIDRAAAKFARSIKDYNIRKSYDSL